MLLLLATAAHAASLDDLAWLTGSWRGQDGATIYEERWEPPLGGAMLGTFRMAKGPDVVFYELMTITADALRIKHFGPELFGWERRREVVGFVVTEVTGTRAVFTMAKPAERLVYTRTGDTLEVVLEQKSGPLTFTFAKAD